MEMANLMCVRVRCSMYQYKLGAEFDSQLSRSTKRSSYNSHCIHSMGFTPSEDIKPAVLFIAWEWWNIY
jgi:hypothetical protein